MEVRFCAGIGDAIISKGLAVGGPGGRGGGVCVGPKSGSKLVT
jgi:hypothetical protein